MSLIFNPSKLEDYEIDAENKKAISNINLVLGHYIESYNDYQSKQEWFNSIKNMAGYLGFAIDNKEYRANPDKYKGNVADVAECIRLGLTGRRNAPDIYEISKILGEEKTKNRLKILYELTK